MEMYNQSGLQFDKKKVNSCDDAVINYIVTMVTKNLKTSLSHLTGYDGRQGIDSDV